MATAMKSRQATQHKAECSGRFTHEVRRPDGKYVTIGTETYRNAAQRDAALASGKAWLAGRTQVAARLVEHFTEDGKSHHTIRAESKPAEAKPVEPIEPWSEVDCVLGVYHRQGVDYTEPSI